MKHLIRTLASLAALFALVSCNKDYISPEELFKDGTKVAKTTIHYAPYYSFHDSVTLFSSASIYRKSDKEGMSWFVAWSGGKTQYDMFMLSIYFDSIDNMKEGATLKPDSVLFTFPASSLGTATTHTFEGQITLADKGDDYAILRFHNVIFSCAFGDYVTDGYLKCQLCNEVVLDN